MYHKTGGRFVIALVTLRRFMLSLHFLSKLLQDPKLNVVDIGHEVIRCQQDLKNTSQDDIKGDAEDYCKKTLVPLSLEMSIHATRNVEEAREKTTRKMEQFLGHMKKRMDNLIKT